MNLASLLALLAITLTDPTGDAIGDGTLDPPTSPIYANVAMFDLQSVQLEVSDTGGGVLTVTLGALGSAVPDGLPEDAEDGGGDAAGSAEGGVPDQTATGDVVEDAEEDAAEFDIGSLLAVVDVYLDTGVGGADQTLSGPNMLLPAGAGWHHAVRISAEGAWGVTYVGAAPTEPGATAQESEPAEPSQSAQPVDDAADDGPADPAAPQGPLAGEPQTLAYVPLAVARAGNTLSMTLPWTFDPEASVDIYAVTGVHDPFSPDGWRGVSQTSSPWAFSGGEQVVPVIDLLAPDSEAQAAALRSGVLPTPQRESGMTLPLSPWLWLMVAGLALALFGLVLRGRVGAPAAKEAAGDAAVTDAGTGAGADASVATEDDEVVIDHVSTAVDEAEHEAGETEPDADEEADEAELVTGTDPGSEVDVAGTLLAFEADDDPEERSAGVSGEQAGEGVTDEGVTGSEDAGGTGVDVVYPEEGAGVIRAPSNIGVVDSELADVTPALVVTDEPEEAEIRSDTGRTDPRGSRTDRSAFSTAVDESYLNLDVESGGGVFGDDLAGGESFWHPGSRLKNSSPSLPSVEEDAEAGTSVSDKDDETA